MKKLIILAAVVFGFAATSFAQATGNAKADATASILASVTITNNNGFDFGSIYSSVLGGTVDLKADNSRVPTGVQLGTTAGKAAKFTVVGSGDGSPHIGIMYTQSPVTLTGPGTAMTLNGIFAEEGGLTKISGSSLDLDVNGQAILFMGGTLNLNPQQKAGTYTNASAVTVTVAY